MDTVSQLDWLEHLTTGQKYLQTARNGLARPSVFNNKLIYHLTAMAIEKMLVGVFQYHRQMPEDHTLDGLVDGLAHICPLDKDLADGIKGIGRFDDMCPLVPVKHRIPDDLEIKAMLAVGEQVAAFADGQVEEQFRVQSSRFFRAVTGDEQGPSGRGREERRSS